MKIKPKPIETHSRQEVAECLINHAKWLKQAEKKEYREYLLWCIKNRVRHMSENSFDNNRG